MKIDPKKEYNIDQIAKLGVLGVKNRRSVLLKILMDRNGKDILQAEMSGDGHGARYQIKGENLIKYND